MHQEIEFTAELDKKQYSRLYRYLSKHFRKAASQKRLMVRLFKNKISVREPIDIRYKWTNWANELVVKKGAVGTRNKQEMIIPLGKRNYLGDFEHLFILQGYKTGVAMYREIEKFKNKNLEFSLVVAGPYYYLEAEASRALPEKRAKEEIIAFFKEVGLIPLEQPEYRDLIRRLDKNANLIFRLREFPKPFIRNPYWKKILSRTEFSVK